MVIVEKNFVVVSLFCLGQVNFLHSNWNGAVVWIQDENNVENTFLVIVEQCLHRLNQDS